MMSRPLISSSRPRLFTTCTLSGRRSCTTPSASTSDTIPSQVSSCSTLSVVQAVRRSQSARYDFRVFLLHLGLIEFRISDWGLRIICVLVRFLWRRPPLKGFRLLRFSGRPSAPAFPSQVPKEDILARGTTDPIADVATQAPFAASLSRSRKASQRATVALCTGSFSPSTTPSPAFLLSDRLEGFHPGGRSFYRLVLVPVCIWWAKAPCLAVCWSI